MTRVLLVVLFSAWASLASAQSPSAATLFRRGMAAFGDERYADAAALFEQAHALSGEPGMLYNLALAQDRAGDTERAVVSYRAFLAASPDAPERAEVEARLAELTPAPIEPEPEPEPIAPTDASPETTRPEVPDVTPPASPVGGVEVSAGGPILIGLGAAGMIAAGVLLGLAVDTHGRAVAEPVQRTALALGAEADQLALASNLLWATGALAIAGLVWLVVDLSTPVHTELSVSATGVSLEGAF